MSKVETEILESISNLKRNLENCREVLEWAEKNNDVVGQLRAAQAITEGTEMLAQQEKLLERILS